MVNVWACAMENAVRIMVAHKVAFVLVFTLILLIFNLPEGLSSPFEKNSG
jgi:hypothetical protein